MQTRSSRGVQQHQVDGAADELLAQGQRPTIEKVRLHLGHGSPNTIAPMLEIWFAGLGKRVRGLAGSQGWGDQLPDWLLQAAETLWTKAQAEASSLADTALQAEREALKQREADMAEQAQALAQREAVMQARLQAQDQALSEARTQNTALLQRLEQAELEAQGQHQHLLGLQEDLRLLRERRHADEDRHPAAPRKTARRATRSPSRRPGPGPTTSRRVAARPGCGQCPTETGARPAGPTADRTATAACAMGRRLTQKHPCRRQGAKQRNQAGTQRGQTPAPAVGSTPRRRRGARAPPPLTDQTSIQSSIQISIHLSIQIR